jgi:hypothetical protein
MYPAHMRLEKVMEKVMNETGMDKQKNLARTRFCFKRIFDWKAGKPVWPSGLKQGQIGVNIG